MQLQQVHEAIVNFTHVKIVYSVMHILYGNQLKGYFLVLHSERDTTKMSQRLLLKLNFQKGGRAGIKISLWQRWSESNVVTLLFRRIWLCYFYPSEFLVLI